MATFKFELVSPERLLLSEEVEQVVVPGSEGDFAVLANHAPVMSTIRPGLLSVTSSGGTTEYVLLGGFADAGPNGLTVLAESASEKSDFDKSMLDERISKARDAFAAAADDLAKQKAQESVDQLSQLSGLL
ncbi:MAG: F0F1 ATP synthase subunit epsilon [Pseudomonadota bacterium]